MWGSDNHKALLLNQDWLACVIHSESLLRPGRKGFAQHIPFWPEVVYNITNTNNIYSTYKVTSGS